ncbi:uncharacterized protein [Porites lutea]|uniref:uncharacterized protein n=1 Tax=Porites lutea TaxID=51062 RepID=UPI003CC56FCE
MKITKQVTSCFIFGLLAIVSAIEDQDEQDNPDVEADEAADAAAAGTTNFRPSTHAPGPWFERIMGLIRSKNFRNIYKNYLGSRGDQDSADTSFDELSRRNFAPGPVKHVYVEEKKIRHHHPHHKRHHHYRRKHKAKKWANVKIVNQVGSRVKIKANKILPSAVLSSGEIFVYHRFLNGKERKAKITLKATDEYTDKPLTINGVAKFIVKPTTYDDTQEVYVYRSDSRSGVLDFRHGHILKNLGNDNRWFYVKLINHAGGHARIVPDQILPATTVNADESQVEYARLEPGDEYKRIVLKAFDAMTEEPLKLNGEYRLGLRPDDAGNVAKVKVTRGDTIYAKCDNFVPMEQDAPFEYQISTGDAKSWFDAVRTCKVCDAELLSVHTREENDFVTKELRKSSEVNKLWIGMSYLEQRRMWSWIDGSRYRYQNWKEGQHYDGKDEQCGIIYQQYDWGRWDDDNCYKPLGYICKRHRSRNSDKSNNSTKSANGKRGCPNISPECPSLCKIVRIPGSCPHCDCGPLVKGYDAMSDKERSRVRNLFSEANRQMHEVRRAGITRARTIRRSRIMMEANRLQAEARTLQEMANIEGIPLNLPFQPPPLSLRRETISKPERNMVREIAVLMNDIEKAEKKREKRI